MRIRTRATRMAAMMENTVAAWITGTAVICSSLSLVLTSPRVVDIVTVSPVDCCCGNVYAIRPDMDALMDARLSLTVFMSV